MEIVESFLKRNLNIIALDENNITDENDKKEIDMFVQFMDQKLSMARMVNCLPIDYDIKEDF